MRACKSCMRLSEEERCPVCGSNTSQYWSGYFAVLDPETSQIAKKMGIKSPGQYALKVR
ncbi:MAG: DNA-directed RNA polymerase subunit E [Candidatus Altiarchaeales archaeon]|nr:DNA-directed RNA polymerase subunit E [Candidatus Altiarchaeales archaeon]MBD3415752.1 DNA-directed RNA polymerase subunit E [Candidatus Altiarchaeales archaeon]